MKNVKMVMLKQLDNLVKKNMSVNSFFYKNEDLIICYWKLSGETHRQVVEVRDGLFPKDMLKKIKHEKR
jgi:hypothetical protein